MTPPSGDELAERGTDRYMRSQGAQTPPRAPVTEIPGGPSVEGSIGARIHQLTELLARLWGGGTLTEGEKAWLDANAREHRRQSPWRAL